MYLQGSISLLLFNKQLDLYMVSIQIIVQEKFLTFVTLGLRWIVSVGTSGIF